VLGFGLEDAEPLLDDSEPLLDDSELLLEDSEPLPDDSEPLPDDSELLPEESEPLAPLAAGDSLVDGAPFLASFEPEAGSGFLEL
jgi:hypothetical protein